MSTFSDIRKEVIEQSQNVNFADSVRRRYLRELSEFTQRDTILYASTFIPKQGINIHDIHLQISQPDISGFMSTLHGLNSKKESNKGLDLILHSPGGSLEATEQIVNYLRSKYNDIRAIIPQNAMSASTMLACACNTIIMGKHSAIGPIDPQMTFPLSNGGRYLAPAQLILDEFNQIKEEIKTTPQLFKLWENKIQSYPHGFLKNCEIAIQLSQERVAEWLDRYMFKNQAPKNGKSIAEKLADIKYHKSHGRPINIDEAKKIGLDIQTLEDDQELQDKVLSVFNSAMTTFEVTGCVKMIENQNGKGS